MTESTLLYFFSTLAQSFAALTAFFFAAAQVRVSWLDDKITATKKAILFHHHGTSHYTVNAVEAEMCKKSATEVVQLGRTMEGVQVEDLTEKLVTLIQQMQDLRTGIRNFVIIGIILTATGIIGILPSKAISESPIIGSVILGTVILVTLGSLSYMGKFIIDSLSVTLKKDIEHK